jgi:hypothetical protein
LAEQCGVCGKRIPDADQGVVLVQEERGDVLALCQLCVDDLLAAGAIRQVPEDKH